MNIKVQDKDGSYHASCQGKRASCAWSCEIAATNAAERATGKPHRAIHTDRPEPGVYIVTVEAREGDE